jgi:2-oxoglutarate ferredoxin oxidoreductase subunit gamma
MQVEFLFSGFGGQGVMFVGQLLAYTAMEEGKEVTWIPSYGPEMRGGTAHCTVVISPNPIGSPVVTHPKIAVVFNRPSFDKYEPIMAEGGVLALNSSLIPQRTKRTDITELAVPASDIADEVGSLKLLNMVMLGAVLTVYPVVFLDSVQNALRNHLPAHRRDMLSMNFEALEKGAAYVGHLAPT